MNNQRWWAAWAIAIFATSLETLEVRGVVAILSCAVVVYSEIWGAPAKGE